MSHLTCPPPITAADDGNNTSDLARGIVFVAVVPFFVWSWMYAVAIAHKTPIGGVVLAATDVSFIVSMVVAITLTGFTVRWSR